MENSKSFISKTVDYTDVDLLKKTFGGKASFSLYMRDYIRGKDVNFLLPDGLELIKSFQDDLESAIKQYYKTYVSRIIRPSMDGDEMYLVDVADSFVVNSTKDYPEIPNIVSMQNKIDGYATNFEGVKAIKLKCFLVSYFIKSCIDINTDKKGWDHSSITNHPNIKDHYIISFLNGRYEVLVNNKGEQIKKYKTSYFISTNIISFFEDYIFQVIEMKKIVDASKFLDPIFATQTEFKIGYTDFLESEYEGKELQKLYLLQHRVFKNYCYENNPINPDNWDFGEFGIKPNLFESLPRISLNNFLDPNRSTIGNIVLRITQADIARDIQSDFYEGMIDKFASIAGVEFLREDNNSIGSMGHNSYRWIQKIPYSRVIHEV